MKIKIYRDAIAPDDLEALKKLIEDAGHEPEVVDGLPGDDCDPDESSAVILYPQDSDFAAAMNAIIHTGKTLGCDVYGVWPLGASEARVTPVSADDAAAGVVPWNPRRLKQAIAAPDTCWDKPNGERRADPDLPRHKCKKKRKK